MFSKVVLLCKDLSPDSERGVRSALRDRVCSSIFIRASDYSYNK